MKKINGTVASAASALVLFAAWVLFSGFSFHPLEKDPPAVFGVVREYMHQTVMPVMKPHRYDFNAKLSQEEQQQLQGIRKDLKLVAEAREKAGLALGRVRLRNTELSDAQVAVVKDTRKRAQKALRQAMVIVDKHEQELLEIFKKEDANRKKWSKDIKQILASKSGKDARLLKPRWRKNIERLFPVEDLSNVAFVIWNPDEQLLK